MKTSEPDDPTLRGAAPEDNGQLPASAGEVVLRVLRVGLHVSFAALLAVGLVRTLLTEESRPVRLLAIALTGLLAALYLAGTIAEKRHFGGRAPSTVQWAKWWLGGVVALWLVLMYLNADYSWLAFPLFFLHQHILGQRHALFAVTLLTAAVIGAGAFHAGTPSAPQVIGPVVGAIFAVVMGMAYRALYTEGVNQRRALIELQATRAALAEEQHRAGTLAERARLAREIHDTLAQGFSSIVLVSRSASAALSAGDTAAAAERLETIGATAAENLAEARDFVRDLSGEDAGGQGLAGRLRRLCSGIERTAAAAGRGFEVVFTQDGTAVPLPAPVSAALLRAAQSGLANVASHARASRAVLSLGYLPDAVTLDVFDDGKGMDLDELPREPRADGTGFGLAGLRRRLELLGGTLDIESAPGEGTVLAVRIPRDGTESENDA
ncbi:sensor histidine kinase [Paeniglutamicibacter sp. R2-26]|uniref:sensor histidine kinase n=1 Tax=Paeniglutamicibacter sp. R2-26 TaxID=3144417 RepID=UPI003EE783F7